MCCGYESSSPSRETISPRTAEWKCCYDERRFSKESGEHGDNLEDDVWDIVVRDALDTATGKNTGCPRKKLSLFRILWFGSSH